MLNFIREVGNFVGQLIGMILEIPFTHEFGESGIGGANFGTIIFIIVIITIGLLFLRGGKGD